MKNITIAGVLLFVGLHAWSQKAYTPVNFTPMKDALKAGNAKELVKYFNNSIDLNLEGDVTTYSKAQAEFVLRDFFKKHAPTDFNIMHTGGSKTGDLQFAIGKYQCGPDSYDVLMRVREVDKNYLIHELSFTKE
jgi:hypothetical protein